MNEDDDDMNIHNQSTTVVVKNLSPYTTEEQVRLLAERRLMPGFTCSH